MVEHIVHISDESFEEEVLQSERPVLIDYWADWCGPCIHFAPVLDEVASEYSDRLKVGKLSVDDNQETAMKYGVRSIPMLTLFKNGEIVASKVGAMSKAKLTEFLDENL